MKQNSFKIKLTFILAYLSLLILVIVKTLPNYRHFFGFAKGYAPHNFAFNGLIYQPLIFLSSLMGIIVIFRMIKSWSIYDKKFLTFGLVIPPIAFWVIELVR